MSHAPSPFVGDLIRRMRRYPEHIAVQSRGEVLSYGELLDRAAALRDLLRAFGVKRGDRVALIGNRGVADYVAMLGIMMAGGAYVPLNPKFPATRNAWILEKSGAVGILADGDNRDLSWMRPGSRARFALCSDNNDALPLGAAPVAVKDGPGFDDGAYIIFTSGTTGNPKGVPITGTNLGAYLANLEALFPVTAEDRIAHLSDLSFDLSVHEVFLAWYSSAALCCIPQMGALMAARYVEEESITVWVSVRSTISLAHKAGTLDPGSMRSIRLAFFCGEALSLATARNFAAAAPNAAIFNLWGPTETTVSFSHFRVDLSQSLPDILPIGEAYANQHLDVVDAAGQGVPAGEIGELVAAGSQVTQGYWQSPELDEGKFLLRDGCRWYRTGDLARWDERYGYCYMGRADRQVKVKGYRVELQECESAIRRIVSRDLVCVIPWPKAENGTASGLVAFICGEAVDAEALTRSLREALPPYMVPDRIATLSEFPFNANGKVDYKALEADAESLLALSPRGKHTVKQAP